MATWASNGQQTGGSGSYVPGTQSVNYILANFAATGDTITMPAGTFSWTSTTTITISVTLEGVNPGQPGNTAPESAFSTIIQNNNTSTTMLSCTAPTNGHITLAYICFKQTSNNSGGSAFCVALDRSDLNGSTIVVTPYTCLVHDCFFDALSVYNYMLAIFCNGAVVWQCSFTTSVGVAALTGIECLPTKYASVANFNTPDTMGGAATLLGVGDTASGWAGVAGVNNTYIETCFLANGPTTVVDSGSNARIVVRYCTIQDSIIASHGGTGENASRHMEIYNNVFNNVNGTALGLNQWVGNRAGVVIVTNNSMASPPAGKAPLSFFVEQVNRANYGGPGQTVYPSARQVSIGWSQAQHDAATSQSGTLNGTVNVTGLNTSTILVGQKVSGTNIPSGCLVQTIVSPTAITLSVAATGSGASTLTFTGIPYGFPPFLGNGLFGNTSFNPSFDYGQQLDPCYVWNNSGAGAPTTNAQVAINQYTPDSFGNNLTIQGQIWFNQQASNFSLAAVTSLAATLPGSQSANVAFPGSWKNDLLLCMLSWTTSGSPTVTVTDGTNTWKQIGSTFNASSGISQAIFAAINTGTTATYTVTAHFSTSVSTVCLNIADYAGNFVSVNQLQVITTDGSNQNASTSSSSLSTGNITTTNNSGGNDLIIVWAKSGNTPTSVSGGWTQQAYDSTNHFGFFDNVGSAGSGGSFATPGTFGLTATVTAPWTASLISFQSMPFLLEGRDFYLNTAMPLWTAFTYPHPLTNAGIIQVSGEASVSGTVNPSLVGQFFPASFMVNLVYP